MKDTNPFTIALRILTPQGHDVLDRTYRPDLGSCLQLAKHRYLLSEGLCMQAGLMAAHRLHGSDEIPTRMDATPRLAEYDMLTWLVRNVPEAKALQHACAYGPANAKMLTDMGCNGRRMSALQLWLDNARAWQRRWIEDLAREWAEGVRA